MSGFYMVVDRAGLKRLLDDLNPEQLLLPTFGRPAVTGITQDYETYDHVILKEAYHLWIPRKAAKRIRRIFSQSSVEARINARYARGEA